MFFAQVATYLALILRKRHWHRRHLITNRLIFDFLRLFGLVNLLLRFRLLLLELLLIASLLELTLVLLEASLIVVSTSILLLLWAASLCKLLLRLGSLHQHLLSIGL